MLAEAAGDADAARARDELAAVRRELAAAHADAAAAQGEAAAAHAREREDGERIAALEVRV